MVGGPPLELVTPWDRVRALDARLSQMPVPDRLWARIETWQERVGCPWALKLISGGLRFDFERPPIPWPHARVDTCRRVHTADERAVLQAEEEQMLALGVVDVVQEAYGQSRGYHARLFVVPQKQQKYRPVLSATMLNRFLRYQHFKMEGLHTVRDLLGQGDWMCKLDIRKAYYHVRLAEDHMPYVRFVSSNGKVCQYRGLPMGVAPAPRLFTKLLRSVLARLRGQGIRIVHYIDDFLVIASSREQCEREIFVVAELLVALGFWLNWEKSVLHPAQEIEFLGTIISSTPLQFCVPLAKLSKLRANIRQFLHKELGTPRQAAALVGTIVSMTAALIPHPMHLRGLTMALQCMVDATEGSYATRTLIPSRLREEFQQWEAGIQAWNGRSLIPPLCAVHIQTDASTSMGWGGVRLDTGEWAQGRWSAEERETSINLLELKAVEHTLKELQPPPGNVSVECDNMTAVACLIGANRTRDPAILATCQRLRQLCDQRAWLISASYLPGRLNGRADHLSRVFEDILDWQLPYSIFATIDRTWGEHTVDLFASARSKQLRRFYSWTPSDQALGMDCFAHSWKGENGFANPPFSLIGRTLQKIQQEECEVTVVAPLWQGQPWFPLLLSMTIESIVLPQQPILAALATCPRVTVNQAWRFGAFRVTGRSSERPESQGLRSS
jgi:hypothetical protein